MKISRFFLILSLSIIEDKKVYLGVVLCRASLGQPMDLQPRSLACILVYMYSKFIKLCGLHRPRIGAKCQSRNDRQIGRIYQQ